MGPHGSKIQLNGIILCDFDPKITFSTSVRVRKFTFECFLRIFEILKEKSEKVKKRNKKGRHGSKLRLPELEIHENIAKKRF